MTPGGNRRLRPRCERGFVAGAEALAVGTLILVAGSILTANAWAVIDTRMALESAAREYLRTYTESTDPISASQDAHAAMRRVLADRPGLLEGLELEPPSGSGFGPCAPASVSMRASVPTIHIPLLDASWGRHTVGVSAAELIDAHREMRSGAAYDPDSTACHD